MLAPVYSQAQRLSKNVPKKETKNLKRWLGWQMWNSDFLSAPPKYLPLSTQLVSTPDSVTFFRMHAFIKNIFHLHLICTVFFLLRCSVSVINTNFNIYFFLIYAQKSIGQILWWSCRPLIVNHCNSRRCLRFLLFLPLLCTKNTNEPGVCPNAMAMKLLLVWSSSTYRVFCWFKGCVCQPFPPGMPTLTLPTGHLRLTDSSRPVKPFLLVILAINGSGRP